MNQVAYEKKNTMNKAQNRKKKLVPLYAFIAIVSAAILLSINRNEKMDHGKEAEKESAFAFQKQGELTFMSAEGNVISKIDIEISDTDEKRELGLMYRTALDEKQGMLFVFENETPLSFWMKNTILPLDIIFVNAKREIIKIHKYTVPFSESPSYDSGKPAMYVVEVNAGYCDKNNVKEGDKIIFSKL